MWFMWNNQDLHAFGCEATGFSDVSEDFEEAMDDWDAFYDYFTEEYNSKKFRRSLTNLNIAFETYYCKMYDDNMIVNGKESSPLELFSSLAMKMFNDELGDNDDILSDYVCWWVKNRKDDVDAEKTEDPCGGDL